MNPGPHPPDHEARERIRGDLAATLLVEAAAGTGKTTSLAGRMVALVASGTCAIETLAAVTFTRKAAAELRARFTAALERAAREAADPAERGRLAAALDRVERCFVGTIHAFCGRLLRERPVEAGVDVAFEEIDADDDEVLRERAWEEFAAGLYAVGDPRLDGLAALGLTVAQLRGAFLRFAEYPDVDEWPAPDVPPGDPDPLRRELAAMVRHMDRVAAAFPPPEERGSDKMMELWEEIVRVARHRDLTEDAQLYDLLERFARAPAMRVTLWPGAPGEGSREQERWEAFTGTWARPALERWRARRYAAAMPLLRDAARAYDRLRAARGALNYQDLLLGARGLLRPRPEVRRYFRDRFTHVLVDEFQDTDPLQAEVLLLLTASDPAEQDWRRCRPVPGSLFVVGDPRQSIYRFRRADIETYERVKRIIREAGGEVVRLDAGFRTLPELVAWDNRVFGTVFGPTATRYAPEAHPLAPARPEPAGESLAGRFTVTAPREASTNDDAAAHDARRVARFVRHALGGGLAVPRRPQETARGVPAKAAPGDFLVLTWRKDRLALYAAALQELGIPCEVSGGSAWGRVEELGLLARCLRALAEPENAVALVAVLRGSLFGFSDQELYEVRRAGGRFSFAAPTPAGLAPQVKARLEDACARLRRYAGWLRAAPPVAALERIAGELGLGLRAAASAGGNVRAGTLAKAFAALRADPEAARSVAALAAQLETLIEEKREFDGVPAREPGAAPVRVMNLHKAKGLEAPVVFLADPGGGRNRHQPALHVDRQGDRVLGYLAVEEPVGEYATRLLAHPAQWEALAREEERFLEAERDRLRYVAATRAGAMLVVSRRLARAGDSPWQFFEGHLGDAQELPNPEAPLPPGTHAGEVTRAEAGAAETAIAARWAVSTAATYDVRGAKEISVSAAELHRAPAGGGEHGTEWGTVIHFLLETALREPARDLAALARAALEEQELDPGLAGEAVAAVDAVRASGVWARAAASTEVLVEVPFSICLAPGDPDLPAPAAVPTLVRGVIDLAFREPQGWVVVDWKTDAARDEAGIAALARRYAPQVRLYARLFSRIAGEQVVERGLFFTVAARYVKLGEEP